MFNKKQISDLQLLISEGQKKPIGFKRYIKALT